MEGEILEAVRAAAAAGLERSVRAARIAAAVREGGGFRWVGVYEVTATQVAVLGWAGPGAPAYPRFDRTQGLTAAAVATGQTVVVDDVATDPRYLTAFGSTRSELIVPVRDAAGQVVGTIDVESERVAAFGPGERALIERCAEAITALYY